MSVEETSEILEGSQIRLSSSVRQRDTSIQLAMNFDPGLPHDASHIPRALGASGPST